MTTTTPALDVRKGTIRPFTFKIVSKSVGFLCFLLFRLRAEGKENIPKEGPFILVANHLHNLDPVFMETTGTRSVFFMAKIELMQVPVLGKVLGWVGAFPINRGKMDRDAIRKAQAILDQGIALGIYPEGTRSKSMKIERVLPGAGLFATGSDVPIVPCAITGSERLPFNGNKQHKHSETMPNPGHSGVLVRYGEAFRLPETINGKRPNATAATDYMMRKVAEMLPLDYRGIYADPVEDSPSDV